MTIGLSFVAFVNILGFGDMVVADCETANPGELYLPKLKAAIHNALGHAEAVDAKITQFSDSIVLASPFIPTLDSLKSFLKLTRDLQSNLFLSGILCRGGISHGRHFHDETILFSQGLIEAYRIENSVSIDPRIVVSCETIDLVAPNAMAAEGVMIDSDGETFLDFLDGLSRQSVEEALDQFRSTLLSRQSRVRSKISWLFRYANFKHPEIVVPAEIVMRQHG